MFVCLLLAITASLANHVFTDTIDTGTNCLPTYNSTICTHLPSLGGALPKLVLELANSKFDLSSALNPFAHIQLYPGREGGLK